jgi:hypothetical protein
MKQRLLLFSVIALAYVNVMALPPKPPAKPDTPAPQNRPDPWKDFRFLIGTWSGDGMGVAGKGIGTMTIETDLNDSVLRMTNQVDFTSADKKTVYKGTMVVYSGQKALFMDNEGHVLHYTVSVAPKTITFISVPERVPVLPRFRFSYQDMGDGKVKCSFNIAPAGSPKYTIHVSGTATKTK